MLLTVTFTALCLQNQEPEGGRCCCRAGTYDWLKANAVASQTLTQQELYPSRFRLLETPGYGSVRFAWTRLWISGHIINCNYCNLASSLSYLTLPKPEHDLYISAPISKVPMVSVRFATGIYLLAETIQPSISNILLSSQWGLATCNSWEQVLVTL